MFTLPPLSLQLCTGTSLGAGGVDHIPHPVFTFPPTSLHIGTYLRTGSVGQVPHPGLTPPPHPARLSLHRHLPTSGLAVLARYHTQDSHPHPTLPVSLYTDTYLPQDWQCWPCTAPSTHTPIPPLSLYTDTTLGLGLVVLAMYHPPFPPLSLYTDTCLRAGSVGHVAHPHPTPLSLHTDTTSELAVLAMYHTPTPPLSLHRYLPQDWQCWPCTTPPPHPSLFTHRHYLRTGSVGHVPHPHPTPLFTQIPTSGLAVLAMYHTPTPPHTDTYLRTSSVGHVPHPHPTPLFTQIPTSGLAVLAIPTSGLAVLAMYHTPTPPLSLHRHLPQDWQCWPCTTPPPHPSLFTHRHYLRTGSVGHVPHPHPTLLFTQTPTLGLAPTPPLSLYTDTYLRTGSVGHVAHPVLVAFGAVLQVGASTHQRFHQLQANMREHAVGDRRHFVQLIAQSHATCLKKNHSI